MSYYSSLLQFSRLFLGFLFFCLLISLVKTSAHAASLVNAKDTVTTSRPSASSPLAADQAAAAGQVTIYDNGSFFLSSDSAKLMAVSGQVENVVTVASMSAANIPTTGQRVVYLGTTAASPHHDGTPFIAPITAMHSIQFTTVTAIPTGGFIRLTFPGGADNSASPSATTFAFNNLNDASGLPAEIVTNNVTCSNDADTFVASPTIQCKTTGPVAPGTTVTMLIGCSAQSSGACTTQAPRLLNPTKSNTAGTATAWKIGIQTVDSGNVNLDNAIVAVGIIESVTVRATVDPSLTFTITGIANATPWSTGNAGCPATETTNSGIGATSTDVNLGVLSNTPTVVDTQIGNISAQRINITTNGLNGYSLTATSSGQLMNPSTGFSIFSTLAPQAFPNGTPFFGLHPCGDDVTTATWNSTGSQNCNTYITTSTDPVCLYAWPTQTDAVTLAGDATGPIGIDSGVTGDGVTSVSYAAGVDASVPPGEYRSIVTYVATPAF